MAEYKCPNCNRAWKEKRIYGELTCPHCKAVYQDADAYRIITK